MNQIRLLLKGTDLKDAEVSGSRGLEVLDSKSNEAGTYLFVEAKVHRPGSFDLKIHANGGSTKARFDMLPPVTKAGRFRGFSSNDLMYMILPDRFADGDLSNDKDVDRKNPRAYHGGDFQGIIDHLAYLKDLGVTALWLAPVCENDSAYHGYNAVNVYAVDMSAVPGT